MARPRGPVADTKPAALSARTNARAHVPRRQGGTSAGLQESVSSDAKSHARRGGRSIRARLGPVKEESGNCFMLLTTSSTAVTTSTGGGAQAPMQHSAQVPQPGESGAALVVWQSSQASSPCTPDSPSPSTSPCPEAWLPASAISCADMAPCSTLVATAA